MARHGSLGDNEDHLLFDVRTAPRGIEMKLLLDDPRALLDFPKLFSPAFVMNRKPAGSSFPLEQLAVEVQERRNPCQV